ncbi:MAG: hypothetical protein U0J65_03700, partial [Christensenellales bacterium]|nr:hypothetical protein [Christensenellales bacterium]
RFGRQPNVSPKPFMQSRQGAKRDLTGFSAWLFNLETVLAAKPYKAADRLPCPPLIYLMYASEEGMRSKD